MLSDVSGYVLAGGRSSRMGQNKALLRLGGMTLLERAVLTLRTCTETVVVVGTDLYPDLEWIRDEHAGQGPLGGIEAALNHLSVDWAAFLPVDMPFLPSELYFALVSGWLEAARSGCRIGMVVANGRSQPLVSVIHKSALPYITESLRMGQNKVMPAFEYAAQRIASELRIEPEVVLRRSEFMDGLRPPCLAWTPATPEAARSQLWFANCNTPEEFELAKRG